MTRKKKLVVSWLGLFLWSALNAAVAQAPSGAKPPIKIGIFLPLSGPFTSYGQPALDGMRLYLDEIGWSVAGRKIDIIVEDDGSEPSQGLTKVKKLVERDKADILTGCVVTSIL